MAENSTTKCKAEDSTPKSKVKTAYNAFVETCIKGHKALITNYGDGLFTSQNLNACKKAFEEAAKNLKKEKTANKDTQDTSKNKDSQIDLFIEKIKSNGQDMENKANPHILAHCYWLLTMPGDSSSKKDQLKDLYIEDKNEEYLFPEAVVGYGQAFSNMIGPLYFVLMYIEAYVNATTKCQSQGQTPEFDSIGWLYDNVKKPTDDNEKEVWKNYWEPAANILLYLQGLITAGNIKHFPIAAQGHKIGIMKAFGEQTIPESKKDQEESLSGISQKIEDAVKGAKIEINKEITKQEDSLSQICQNIENAVEGAEEEINNEITGQEDSSNPNENEDKNQKKKDIDFLKKVNQELESIDFDNNPFYSSILRPFWNSVSDTQLDELSALKFKGAIILYGPPGTSKTYQAKSLARQIICTKIKVEDYLKKTVEFEKQIEEQIFRLQLHPNYTYEDFVWGYQIDESGKTVAKPGYLMRLLKKIEDDKEHDNKEYVLILDEINRVDLARLFGEVFSGIENRGEKIDLQQKVDGKKSIVIPKNLKIIGTMNEIDFSLERVDFALRRRFLWFFKGYDKDILSQIIDSKVKAKKRSIKDKDAYIKCCTSLNNKIKGDNDLGEQFEIGHTFFAEIVDIMAQGLSFANAKKNLWNLSIKPMLEAFLGNMPADERKKKIGESSKNTNSMYTTFFPSK